MENITSIRKIANIPDDAISSHIYNGCILIVVTATGVYAVDIEKALRKEVK